MTVDRAGLFAVLEAHYGRLMALHVKQTANELQKAADSVAEGRHAMVRRGVEPAEVLQRAIRVSVREIVKDVDEARQVLMVARQVKDDELQYFVNWRTNTKWREEMERLGYRWDDEAMRWLMPGWDI